MRDPERTRDAILTAAEHLIARKGLQALTLDEVAAGASVSKGGLLHHYRSKQALVAGLADRMIRLYDEEIENYRQQDLATPGSYTRAYLRANVAYAGECTLCAALSAESRNYPEMRTKFQDHWARCQRKLEDDGLDPIAASIVRYAAEGIMSASMWSMPRPSDYDELVQRLVELAGGTRLGIEKKSKRAAS